MMKHHALFMLVSLWLLLLTCRSSEVRSPKQQRILSEDEHPEGEGGEYDGYGDDDEDYGRSSVKVDPHEALLPLVNVTASKGRAAFIDHNLLFPELCQKGHRGLDGEEEDGSLDAVLPTCFVSLVRGVLISVKNATSGKVLNYDNADLHLDTPDGTEVSPSGDTTGGDTNVFVMVEEPYTNSDDVLFESGSCHAHYVVDVFSPRTASNASLRAKICINVVNHRPVASSQYLFLHRQVPWVAPTAEDRDGCRNSDTGSQGLKPVYFSAKMTSEGGDLVVDDVDSSDKSKDELQRVEIDAEQLRRDGWHLSSDSALMCPATSNTSSSPSLSTFFTYTVTDDEGLVSFPATVTISFVAKNETLPGSMSGTSLKRRYSSIKRVQALPQLVVCDWIEEDEVGSSDNSGSSSTTATTPSCAFRIFTMDLLSSSIANTVAISSTDGSSRLLPIDLGIKVSATSESEGSFMIKEDVLSRNSVARSAHEVEAYYNPVDAGAPVRAVFSIRAVAEDASMGKSGGTGQLDWLLTNVTAVVREGKVKLLQVASTSGGETRVDSDLEEADRSLPAELLIAPSSSTAKGNSGGESAAAVAPPVHCGESRVEWVSLLDAPMVGCIDSSSVDEDCAVATAATDSDMMVKASSSDSPNIRTVPLVISFNLSIGSLYSGPNTAFKKQPGKLLYTNRELIYRVDKIGVLEKKKTSTSVTSIGGCFFHAVLLRELRVGDVLLSESDLAWIPLLHNVNRSAHMFSAAVCGSVGDDGGYHNFVSLIPMIGGKNVCSSTSSSSSSSSSILVFKPEEDVPSSEIPQKAFVRKRQLFDMPKQYDSDELLDSARLPQYISSSDATDADISPVVIPITLDDIVPFYKLLLQNTVTKGNNNNSASSTGSEDSILLRYQSNGFLSLYGSLLNKGVVFPVTLNGGGGAISPRTVIVVPPTSIANEVKQYDDQYLQQLKGSATLSHALVEAIIALTGASKRLALVSTTFPRSLVAPRKRLVLSDLANPTARSGVIVDTIMVNDGTPELELFVAEGRGVEPPEALTTRPYTPSQAENLSKRRMLQIGLQRTFKHYLLPDVYFRARRRNVQTIFRLRLYVTSRRQVAVTFTTSAFMSTTNLDRVARLVMTKVPTYCRVLAANASRTSKKGIAYPDDWRSQLQQASMGDPFTAARFFIDNKNGLDRTTSVLIEMIDASNLPPPPPSGVLLDEVRFAVYNGNFYTSNEVSVEIEISFSSQEADDEKKKKAGGDGKNGPTAADGGVVTLVEEGGSSAALLERMILAGAVFVIAVTIVMKRRAVKKFLVAVLCPNRGWELLDDQDDGDEGEGDNSDKTETRRSKKKGGKDDDDDDERQQQSRSSSSRQESNSRSRARHGSPDSDEPLEMEAYFPDHHHRRERSRPSAATDDDGHDNQAVGANPTRGEASLDKWEDFSDDDDFFNEPAAAAKPTPAPADVERHAVVTVAAAKTKPLSGFKGGAVKKLASIPQSKMD